MQIRDAVLQVEVARTPAAQQEGLSRRSALPPLTGMVFVYDTPVRPSFWMPPTMAFDLDIVWIRGSRIVDLTLQAVRTDAPPWPQYSPSVPVDLVLEVPAGTARQWGWRIGDAVYFRP